MKGFLLLMPANFLKHELWRIFCHHLLELKNSPCLTGNFINRYRLTLEAFCIEVNGYMEQASKMDKVISSWILLWLVLHLNVEI